MKTINGLAHVSYVNMQKFYEALRENINQMQEKGMEVEIQYGCTTNRFTALLIGRKRKGDLIMNMKLDEEKKKTVIRLDQHETANGTMMRILKRHGAVYVRETKKHVYYESNENLFVTLRDSLCGGK